MEHGVIVEVDGVTQIGRSGADDNWEAPQGRDGIGTSGALADACAFAFLLKTALPEVEYIVEHKWSRKGRLTSRNHALRSA